MTSEDTEDLLNQRVGAYVLAVETMKNGQEAISAQDVGAFLCVYWNCEAADQRPGPLYLVPCF